MPYGCVYMQARCGQGPDSRRLTLAPEAGTRASFRKFPWGVFVAYLIAAACLSDRQMTSPQAAVLNMTKGRTTLSHTRAPAASSDDPRQTVE